MANAKSDAPKAAWFPIEVKSLDKSTAALYTQRLKVAKELKEIDSKLTPMLVEAIETDPQVDSADGHGVLISDRFGECSFAVVPKEKRADKAKARFIATLEVRCDPCGTRLLVGQ
jgi:hypothetical protein